MKYIVLAIVTGLMSFAWPVKLEQKIRATIEKTFQKQDYFIVEYDFKNEGTPEVINALNGHFFKINSKGDLLGYIYTSEAPSMKNIFDYILVFDIEMNIINSKVLIYREKHGRQIGTKRWLSQFIGLTLDDRPELGKDIDGISGATISATNMTMAVNSALQNLSNYHFD